MTHAPGQQAMGYPALPTVDDRRAHLESELSRCIEMIVAEMEPELVILFGSLVSGQVHEWSDLDLVAVVETPLPFFARSRHILDRLQPKVSIDLLIYTPQEWQEICKTRPFVREEILNKGCKMYERAR